MDTHQEVIYDPRGNKCQCVRSSVIKFTVIPVVIVVMCVLVYNPLKKLKRERNAATETRLVKKKKFCDASRSQEMCGHWLAVIDAAAVAAKTKNTTVNRLWPCFSHHPPLLGRKSELKMSNKSLARRRTRLSLSTTTIELGVTLHWGHHILPNVQFLLLFCILKMQSIKCFATYVTILWWWGVVALDCTCCYWLPVHPCCLVCIVSDWI